MSTTNSLSNFLDISSLDFSNPNEITTTLIKTKTVRIERIVSYGQISENWYNQDQDEWLVLLQGNASLLYENGLEIFLSKGDSLHIPAHQKHKVTFTSANPPCIWLAIFYESEN